MATVCSQRMRNIQTNPAVRTIVRSGISPIAGRRLIQTGYVLTSKEVRCLPFVYLVEHYSISEPIVAVPSKKRWRRWRTKVADASGLLAIAGAEDQRFRSGDNAHKRTGPRY